MARKSRADARGDMLQGTLDMLILKTLITGPAHGHTIANVIEKGSDEVLQVEHGSLYPALHRLERQKLIAATWKVSDSNQRVREYRLTPKGKRQLTSSRSRWEQLQAAIAGVMKKPGFLE